MIARGNPVGMVFWGGGRMVTVPDTGDVSPRGQKAGGWRRPEGPPRGTSSLVQAVLFFFLVDGHHIPDTDIEIHKSNKIQEIDNRLLILIHGRGQIQAQTAQT
jgi:hypothetical protein